MLHRAALLASVALGLGLCFTLPQSVQAQGSYFLLEVDTGLSESAYQSGSPGIYYGFRSGLTFKPVSAPIRFHLLMGAGLRNSQLVGAQAGLLYTAEQLDLDLYGSARLVVPILGVRAYAEVGLGDRLSFQSLVRDPSLGSLSVWSDQLLLFTAIGVQARLTENISAGVRLELNPLSADPTLISRVTGHPGTELRTTGMIHLGLHF